VLGPPGATPSNPGGPREGRPDPLAGLSEEQLLLGRVQPFWVPDTDAPDCMICGGRFTLVKRRHHCRACGKVLCAACCADKHALVYLDSKEGRVCTPCRTVLARLDTCQGSQQSSHALATPPDPALLGARPRPNPANPMEYCSTVPVSEQVATQGASPQPLPSVLVPVGVLKRGPGEGDDRSGSSQENKSVMFSDGIRPGGDLTELDGRGAEHRTLGRRPGRGRSGGRRQRGRAGPAGAQVPRDYSGVERRQRQRVQRRRVVGDQ
jgi:MAD (mothers against decapentaplegic) interacting protein